MSVRVKSGHKKWYRTVFQHRKMQVAMYLWVGNRVHVDKTVFVQNAMYNILNWGTPYAELPVCGE